VTFDKNNYPLYVPEPTPERFRHLAWKDVLQNIMTNGGCIYLPTLSEGRVSRSVLPLVKSYVLKRNWFLWQAISPADNAGFAWHRTIFDSVHVVHSGGLDFVRQGRQVAYLHQIHPEDDEEQYRALALWERHQLQPNDESIAIFGPMTENGVQKSLNAIADKLQREDVEYGIE